MTDRQKEELERIIKVLKNAALDIDGLNSDLEIDDFSYQLSHTLIYAEESVDLAVSRLHEVLEA